MTTVSIVRSQLPYAALNAGLLAILVAALAQVAGLRAESAQTPIVVTIDMRVAGNTPRQVAGVDDCAEAALDATTTVDVLLPGDGVPAAHGLSAFQYSLFYDPLKLSITADARGQLIEQAPASNVVHLADPLPDRNGVYVSWAVDFGRSEVEPLGSSEAGPGVLSRLTLTTIAPGTVELILADVKLIDYASEEMPVAVPGRGKLAIGGSCPGAPAVDESPSTTPAATAAITATPAPPVEPAAEGAPLPVVGGPPGPQGGSGARPLALLGLVLLSAGAGLVLATRRT